MFRVILLALGFIGGIIVGRNAESMDAPEFGAVVLCLIIACGIMWTMGYSGKSSAVATAVANATATANANADARAQSVANSAINLYLGQQAGFTPEMIGSIVDRSITDNKQKEKAAIENISSIDSEKSFCEKEQV